MKKIILPALVGMLTATTLSLHAQTTLTVAQDGTGDYTTIQAAVDAAKDGEQTTIRIKAGTYQEQVNIGTRQKASSKILDFIGDGIDKTIITSPLGLNTTPKAKDIYATAAMAVYATDFYAQDITFSNTAGKSGGQALALFVSGDRQTYNRCRLAGYQDTHRSKKGTRSYYKDCIIEGATDFIYAGGTCWFEHCTLSCLAGGWITAPEDITASTTAADGTKIWLGFLFNNCTVTGTSSVSKGSVYLGRCWGAEKCGSLFMNCDLGGLVNQNGWQTMGSNDGKKSYYAEYNSRNGNDPADVSKRISWSHQLAEADYQRLASWTLVDALYRQSTGTSQAYAPEEVIASHEGISANDYAPLESQLLAFPTARGFGKFASGGRGGKVVEVTNLNDSGEGSLRWALTEAGRENATIVFRVSGTITIGPNPQRKTENSIRATLKNVTIAGQTAPGEGILLRGGKLNLGGSSNVIIRNIRSRLGVNEDPTKSKEDNFIAGGAIGIENATNIIIDHCCFGWSGEENMTMYDNHFTTVQWCIVHEGLYNAGHPKGARGYGCQWGGSPATFHHNLLANNDSRSPRVNGASNESQDRNVFMEYMNNVNFNWGRQNSCYGGENEAGNNSSHECNFVGNYYKPGPARTSSSYFIEMSAARSGKTLNGPSIWYLNENTMEGNATASADNWKLINNKTGYALTAMRSDTLLYPSPNYKRLTASKIEDYNLYRTPTESAQDAYDHVLAKAGTVNRDATEMRIVEEVRTGNPKYTGKGANKQGIIDTPADADGWPTYADATAPADNDHDGMADEWELANGFNPGDPTDGSRVASAEGYTALEIYLNSLMGEHIPMLPTDVSAVRQQPVVNSTAVYSLGGSKVRQLNTADTTNDSLSGLPAGVYIVRQELSDLSVQSKKFIKK